MAMRKMFLSQQKQGADLIMLLIWIIILLMHMLMEIILYFHCVWRKWLLQEEMGAAIVFAHELAHNANHHVDDKIANANTGALVGLLLGIAIGANPSDAMDLGANIGATSYSIDYENEADYLSVYILALSGYDITRAPNFWRRFAVEVPNSIYSGGGTHPSTSERYVRLETYVKEVQDQIDKGVQVVT